MWLVAWVGVSEAAGTGSEAPDQHRCPTLSPGIPSDFAQHTTISTHPLRLSGVRHSQAKEGSAEAALEKLQAFYSACKAIEQRLSQRKSRLKAKIPDIESTYNALLQMQQQVRTLRPSRRLTRSVASPPPRPTAERARWRSNRSLSAVRRRSWGSL
jgi:hypothetical protein